MPYVKNVWVDEVLTETPPLYNVLNEADEPVLESVQIELETPVVTPGTALTADKMNNIEEGIEANDLAITALAGELASEVNTLEDSITGLSDSLSGLSTQVSTNQNTVNAHFSLLELGWIAMPGTMSYSSADAPSFVASVNTDVTSFLSVGDKIWLTQTTSKYFVVTAIGAFSGGACLITLYGGYANGNFTLANAAITGVHFSKAKSPFGFPLSRDIWDVLVVGSGAAAKSSASINTWYGGSQMTPAGPSINIPIGMWDTQYEILAEFSLTLAAQGAVGGRISFSTSDSAESDSDFTGSFLYTAPAGAVQQRVVAVHSKVLTLAAKATYYPILFIGAGSSITMTINGSFKSILRARFCYL